jgi:hypothetical protein
MCYKCNIHVEQARFVCFHRLGPAAGGAICQPGKQAGVRGISSAAIHHNQTSHLEIYDHEMDHSRKS